MNDFLREYVRVILDERFWSWSLIGIAYVIIGYIIRAWFLSSMVQRAKDLPSRYYQEIKHNYLKKSFWGWFFFFLPLIFFTLVWNQAEQFPPQEENLLLLILGLASFIGSVMIHMRAFAAAATLTLKNLVDEREIRNTIKKQQPS